MFEKKFQEKSRVLALRVPESKFYHLKEVFSQIAYLVDLGQKITIEVHD